MSFFDAAISGRRKRPASRLQIASNSITNQPVSPFHWPSDTVPGVPKAGEPGSPFMQKQVKPLSEKAFASWEVNVDLPRFPFRHRLKSFYGLSAGERQVFRDNKVTRCVLLFGPWELILWGVEC